MKKIFFLFVLLFVIGCKSEKKWEYGHINLKEGFKKKEFILLSEVAEDIEYVFLETNDNGLISDIRKVIFDPPYFFIMDSNEKSIVIFDENGKYINTITKHGQGPQEYLGICDFDVYNHVIYILDNNQLKIVLYDINGNFIDTFKFTEYATSLKVLSENEIITVTLNGLIYSNEGYVFSEYDKNFNLKRRFKSMNKNERENCYSTISFYKQKDTLVYWEYNVFDTVYNIFPDGSSEVRFCLDPGRIPSSLVQSTQESHKVAAGQFEIGSLIETEDYVFIFSIYNRQFSSMIYNKNNNRTIGIENYLANDIDGGGSFWPSFKINDNKVGATIFPFEMKAFLEKEIAEYHKDFNYKRYRPKLDYDVEKHKKLLEQLENTDDMSNPVLRIVTMK